MILRPLSRALRPAVPAWAVVAAPTLMLAALAVAALALDSAGRSAAATAPAIVGGASVRAASGSGAYQAVAVGTYHTCAIETDGTLTCWGGDASEQLNAPAGTFTSIGAGARD